MSTRDSVKTRTLVVWFAIGLTLSLGSSSEVKADDLEEMSSIVRFRGEELYYSIELWGAEMARGALIMGDFVEDGGRQYLQVAGLAMTEGVAAMVYPMHDTANTVIDPFSGLAVTTVKELDERGQYRRYNVEFAPLDFKARVVRLRDGAESRYNRILPSETYDAMSWIYAIREQDLTPGTTAIYWMYDGWKLSRVTVTVLEGHDTLLVGDEFMDCRQLQLTRDVMETSRPVPFIQETVELPSIWWVQQDRGGEQVGILWLTDDERRLPVQITFENDLVTATAHLLRYQSPMSGY